MLKNKKEIVFIIFFVAIGIYIIGNVLSSEASTKEKVVVYKSPNCGCCVKHIAYLKEQGYEVEIITTADTKSIKAKYSIPANMQSCHTTVIGNYFVEGHVPIEAIEKLLSEKPEIDGIALPEMPAGSPGMPGIKSEPFIIYLLKDGKPAMFMEL